jgi:hypothetical protein
MGRKPHKTVHRYILARNAREARLGGEIAELSGVEELGQNEYPRAKWSQISPRWLKWYQALAENVKIPILNRLSTVKAMEIDDAVLAAGRTAEQLKQFACLVMKRRLAVEISAELPIDRYSELLYLFQTLEEAPGLLLKVVTIFAKQENNSKTIVERFLIQNNINSVDEMTSANKETLLNQLRGAISQAGLDAIIVEDASKLPIDPRTTKERVQNAVELLHEISQGNVALLLAEVIEHLDLKEQMLEKLDMHTKKFSAEDMIAFMCLNHKISFSVLDLMWRAAPEIFPSPTDVDNRLKANLGKLKIGREVMEDGTSEARMFIYREVLIQRLQALIASKEVSAAPEERIIITWVLWLDGYSQQKQHHDPAMKTGLHRWVAAGKIVQMDKLDSEGKFHEIYRPDKVDSRRDAVPILICRGKEESATVRRYLESWSNTIDEGEQGMFLDPGRTKSLHRILARVRSTNA